MESFGFESELEPQEGNVPSGGGSGFRQDSGKECDGKVGTGEKLRVERRHSTSCSDGLQMLQSAHQLVPFSTT